MTGPAVLFWGAVSRTTVEGWLQSEETLQTELHFQTRDGGPPHSCLLGVNLKTTAGVGGHEPSPRTTEGQL